MTYHSWHRKLRRLKGEPGRCVECGSTGHNQWALCASLHVPRSDRDNERLWIEDPDVYESLCASCHQFRDVPAEQRVAHARSAGLAGGSSGGRAGNGKPGGLARGKQIKAFNTVERTAHLTQLAEARTHITREARARAGSIGGKIGGRIAGAKVASMLRKCGECPMTATPPTLGRHQKSAKHAGWTEITA